MTLNTDPDLPADGELTTAMGFGFTSPSGSISSVLNKVEVDVHDFGVCGENHGSSIALFRETQTCAGSMEGEKTLAKVIPAPHLWIARTQAYNMALCLLGLDALGSTTRPS